MGDVGWMETVVGTLRVPSPDNGPITANDRTRSVPATSERFWFCGRKSHRVVTPRGTLFTIPCEAIFNQHPRVYRSALVGVGPAGRQQPVIVAEPWPEKRSASQADERQLLAELRELGRQHAHTAEITVFFIHRALPVDIRHNAKIFREQLAIWAAARLPPAA